MSEAPRVAVVGAGVVGLSTAAALLDSGAEVRLYERNEPGLGQSNGRTRVFRLAHGHPRLVALAAESRRLWQDWETRFRRRLIGDEGLIITGDETVAVWTQAMSEAGARHEVLSVQEAGERLPVARLTGSSALFDPSAGPTRARRAVECLQSLSAPALRREEVIEIETSGNGSIVSTSGGRWECDEVVVTAGIETGRLAASAGIGIETPIVYDSRFTFPIAADFREQSLPCWFDTSGSYGPGYTSYGQRVGSTDYYAVAVSSGDTEALNADEESARHREALAGYLPQAYPGLESEPVDQIRCSYALPLLRDDGDGFMARRNGGVTALYGNNLFKFAPLLGQLLAKSAVTGSLAPELMLDRAL